MDKSRIFVSILGEKRGNRCAHLPCKSGHSWKGCLSHGAYRPVKQNHHVTKKGQAISCLAFPVLWYVVVQLSGRQGAQGLHLAQQIIQACSDNGHVIRLNQRHVRQCENYVTHHKEQQACLTV